MADSQPRPSRSWRCWLFRKLFHFGEIFRALRRHLADWPHHSGHKQPCCHTEPTRRGGCDRLLHLRFWRWLCPIRGSRKGNCPDDDDGPGRGFGTTQSGFVPPHPSDRAAHSRRWSRYRSVSAKVSQLTAFRGHQIGMVMPGRPTIQIAAEWRKWSANRRSAKPARPESLPRGKLPCPALVVAKLRHGHVKLLGQTHLGC